MCAPAHATPTPRFKCPSPTDEPAFLQAGYVLYLSCPTTLRAKPRVAICVRDLVVDSNQSRTGLA